MFSSGNVTEKIRMSKLNCENEVVVDMFAGNLDDFLIGIFQYLIVGL